MIVEGIEVTVTKKAIKNMHLYVKAPDGRVELSAPKRLSEESIVRFIRSKANWIRRQKAKFSNEANDLINYSSGEAMCLWGQKYILQVTQGRRFSLCLKDAIAYLTIPEDSDVERRKGFVNEWYKKALGTEIERSLPYWGRITGLYPSGWMIRDMTTRWGTCNVKTGKLCFNLQLIKRPRECLEYVVLHELAHLIEPSHNYKFKAILDKFMPNWRAIRKRLNGIG